MFTSRKDLFRQQQLLKSAGLLDLSAMRHNKVCRHLLKLISRNQLATKAKITLFLHRIDRNVSYSSSVRSISTSCSNLKLHHSQPKVVSSPQHAELFVASLRKSDRGILEEALKKYNSGNQGLRVLSDLSTQKDYTNKSNNPFPLFHCRAYLYVGVIFSFVLL